jgi:hypothetical protein
LNLDVLLLADVVQELGTFFELGVHKFQHLHSAQSQQLFSRESPLLGQNLHYIFNDTTGRQARATHTKLRAIEPVVE